jgi:beta-lactamase superfamily II metal-dependent hydrolase
VARPKHPSITDLLQTPSANDTSAPNRSSIVLLAEYAGNTVLLPGDATPRALLAGIRRLLAQRSRQRLELTAFKLPHHGSTRNITKDLLELLPADNYLFSSDGGIFGHPDALMRWARPIVAARWRWCRWMLVEAGSLASQSW